MTPHLPVPRRKTAGTCQTPLLQAPVGSPQPSYLPPAAKIPPPFPLPASDPEPKVHVAVPAPQRPSDSPPPARAARPAQLQGRACTQAIGIAAQANTAHFRKP